MTATLAGRGTGLLDLVAAEWIKLRSLRSTWWVLGLGTLAVIGINVNSVIDAYHDWPRITATPGWVDPNGYAFTHNAASLLMLAAGCVGAVSVVGEYGTGLIRTTFAAVPARVSVVIAKAVVLVGVFAVVGTIVALCSFLAGQLILDGRVWRCHSPTSGRSAARPVWRCSRSSAR